MLKKMTALFLLMAFTQVHATSPLQQSFSMSSELNQAYDELSYKLNVEWDQKDKTFFDGAIDKFEKEISNLQQLGLTNKELVLHTLGKIKDKETQTEINELTKIINDSQMSNEEALSFTLQRLNSTYSHGASWSGGKVGEHMCEVLIAVILIYCCTHNNRTPDQTNQRPPLGNQPPIISDMRLKKDIKNISDALEKLSSLDGVTYNWNHSFHPELNLEDKPQMGVLAQQVEKVFPQAVVTNEAGIKAVTYNMLIAPTIEAIKELKKENAEMKSFICSAHDNRASFCSKNK